MPSARPPPKPQTAREIFDGLDVDGGGSISPDELGIGLAKLGHAITRAELYHLVDKLDTDGNGTLEYEEFEIAAKSFLVKESVTKTVSNDLRGAMDYLGDEPPDPVRTLRPQEKQALVDIEWERLRREHREMDSWRDEMAPALEQKSERSAFELEQKERTFERTAAQRAELARHPQLQSVDGDELDGIAQGVGEHQNNTEKLSEYRSAAHGLALSYQRQGTAHMKARNYEQAAVLFKKALTEGPTAIAYKDFLDSWKIAELERDLARAEEMSAMGERASIMGDKSAAEIAMLDKLFAKDAENRELMQHHFATDYEREKLGPNMAGWGGTSVNQLGPSEAAKQAAREHMEVAVEFEQHFNADAAVVERAEAHKLAAQALADHEELMKVRTQHSPPHLDHLGCL